MPTTTTTYPFGPNNPQPQSGTGPFGLVPGAISTPNVFSDLSKVYPNLSGTNENVSGLINSQLSGQLSPQTMNALKDASARFGVASGMPGSGLATNQLFGNIADFSQKLQQQGIQNYNQTIPTISSTQTVNPALQTQIAETNAVNAAAPNPEAAQTYAKKLFDQYLQKLSGGSSPWGFHPVGRSPTTSHTNVFGTGVSLDFI